MKVQENTRLTVSERDSIVVTYFKAEPEKEASAEQQEEKKEPKIQVSLNADAFTYNEATKKYSISLSNVRVIKSDFYGNSVTIEIDEKLINKEKSDNAVDDKYIEQVLDEIEKSENEAGGDD